MKLKASISIINVFAFIFWACQTSQPSSNIQGKSISKITLDKITIGKNSSLVITNEKTIKNVNSQSSQTQTDKNSWKQINLLVSKLNLNEINLWEAPSNARFHDGAMATTIIIVTGDSTYYSQSFDEGKPPAQLSELYNYLVSLENQ